MRKSPTLVLSIVLVLFLITSSTFGGEAASTDGPVSGSIIDGYRVVMVSDIGEPVTLRAFRGDYIKFLFDESIGDTTLSIPDLGIQTKLTRDLATTPYFKMKTVGTFSFSLDSIQGTLTIIEYKKANYRTVTAREAADMLNAKQPLLLDVRTREEFKHGHIKGAVLIPLQELQTRLKELTPYKDQEILIYCATGNRSTVASKILIDKGFKDVINMRYGIVDWYNKKYPINR